LALLTPGYWQSTYWPSNYWQEDYWPEFGLFVPPTPVVVEPVGTLEKKKPEPKLKWLPAIRDYLQWKVSA